MPYISNMGEALAAADLVLSRAGASSIAEIAAVGVPSVLVPYPHATADHQTVNARFLTDAAAAELVPDARMDGPEFAETLLGLVDDPARRSAMREAALGSGSRAPPRRSRTRWRRLPRAADAPSFSPRPPSGLRIRVLVARRSRKCRPCRSVSLRALSFSADALGIAAPCPVWSRIWPLVAHLRRFFPRGLRFLLDRATRAAFPRRSRGKGADS